MSARLGSVGADGQQQQQHPGWFTTALLSYRHLCSKREELAPFQAAEAIEVRRKTDAFTEKVEKFRAFFLQRAPFAAPGGQLSAEQV